MVQRAKMMLGRDEELGKRDDEYKPNHPSFGNQWYRMLAKKRGIAGLFVSLFLLYVFIHNIPTDLRPVIQRPSYGGPQQNPYQPPQWERPSSNLAEAESPPPLAAPPKPPASAGQITDAAVHYYEGPVKFYYLATSLHSISRISGNSLMNRNVLFAASDLQSAAAIIPLACEMSRWKRNFVHMAFFGREEISVEDLKSINGVDKATCDVYWHDARPDYASFSSDKRMEISVAGALSHIHTFMHPQILITADSAGEDDFFARPARTKAKELSIPVMEIPLEGAERLAWMTRLDAAALHNWHSSGIDVVVQAPSDSSGAILRLLKSLEQADYAGFNPPRLTIELPTKLDEETEAFIKSFQWPPLKYQHHAHRNELILHRRIPQRSIDEEEAAIRFIESFYPASLTGPHILLLSPQAELSPAFFHYLKYYLLEYKYTTIGGDTDFLMGISLEAPSVYLNGSASFVAPADPLAVKDDTSPFLWQAPNSNAVLYFADKWMEVHSFLTRRHNALQHALTKEHHKDRTKYVSRRFPAWAEYFLDLMNSRAYTIQYPGHTRSPSFAEHSLVIVHNELYQPPEEYTRKPTTWIVSNGPLPTESVLTASTDYLTTHDGHQTQPNNVELPLLQSLLTLVPPFFRDEADKPTSLSETTLQPPPVQALSSLLRLEYQGDVVTQDEMSILAAAAANEYRRLAGGCSATEADGKEDNVVVGRAEDLFCLDDKTDETDTTESVPSTSTSSKTASITAAPAVTATRIFGGDGAASTVDRVVNPARYQETALAGFRDKIKGLKKPAAEPEAVEEGPVATTDQELTPMEKKELEDWQAEVRRTDSSAAAQQRDRGGKLGRIPVFVDEDPEPGSPRTRPVNMEEEANTESTAEQQTRSRRGKGGKLGPISVVTDEDPEPGSSPRRRPGQAQAEGEDGGPAVQQGKGGKLGRIQVLTDDDPEPGRPRERPEQDPSAQQPKQQSKPQRGKAGNQGKIPIFVDEDPEQGSAPRTRPAIDDEDNVESFKFPAIPSGDADPDNDGRVRIQDLNVRVKADGSASLLDADGDEELVSLHAESGAGGEDSVEPTETGYIHGSDGAAATIVRVVDPAAYQATARAGFRDKMKEKQRQRGEGGA